MIYNKEKKPANHINLFKYKYNRLFKYKSLSKEKAIMGEIGIPRALNMYEDYPFWHTFFTELGFRVVLSDRSSKNLYQSGITSIVSETVCYPAKLVHGHIENLIEKGIKYIFYPCIVNEKKEDMYANNNYNCPVVISYSEVIKNNVDGIRKNNITYINPFLSLNNKEKLNTFSIDYTDNEKYFKANEFQPNSDAYWVVKMADYIKSNHHNVILDNTILANYLKEATLASDLPLMADIDSSLYLFSKEVRKHATVVLSGECADEVFGGYPWYTKDYENIEMFPWQDSLNHRKNILAKSIADLPIEEYAKQMCQDSIKKVPKVKGESKRDERMRELTYLNLKWFMITLLNRKDRMTMANSLEGRVPYADKTLVEYAYNIPADMKLLHGREKGLLRESMRTLLPDEIIDRKKSPYPKTHNPIYTKAVCKMLNDIAQDPNAKLFQIVDKEAVINMINTQGRSFTKPWFGQLMTGPQVIAYLIQLETWLNEYNVKLDI